MRGVGIRSETILGLPPRTFFYTVDQIAYMLEIPVSQVLTKLLHFADRDPGAPPREKMRAINISEQGETPEWRISEASFIGWLKVKGIRFYTRGYRA